MNDVFDKFRKQITGKLLTIIEAAVPEGKRLDAVMSLTRQAITKCLADFMKDLRGED